MSERRLKPVIVPIFIPHRGCPHRCAFCDQWQLTAPSRGPVNGATVTALLDAAVRSRGFHTRPDREVAFYGGTFTRLPRDRMKELLDAVAPYISEGHFQSIRISTRPDALDAARLELMKRGRVLTVELGAQSMDNRVLSLSRRGHTADDTRQAVRALRQYGFNVGIQLMPGLPGDSAATFRSTISEVVALHPDMARLYPALVIRGTLLAHWYREGAYRPLGLDAAVDICAESCRRLESQGIPVIRIGIQGSPSLLESAAILAGPWHPAFGFLVRSRMHRQGIVTELPEPGVADRLRVRAPANEIALIHGYRNEGLAWIRARTGAKQVTVRPDDTLASGTVRFEKR